MTPAPHRDPRLPRPARLFVRLLSRDSASTDLEADVAELFASRRRARGAIYAWWRLGGDLWSVTWRRRRVVAPGSIAVTSAATAWHPTSWLGDARHAFRWLRRYPSLTVPALISLSLAIGAGTAVFSVLNATFLREYLAADASIVWVWRLHENGAARTWRPAEFLALRRLAKTVTLEGALSRAALLPVAPAPAAGAGDGDGDDPASVAFVTDGYLQAFAPPPAAGRLLGHADAQADAAPVAVVSHRFWRRALGGDRTAVGREIRIAGTPVRIVGIAAREYVDPSDGTPDVWVPFSRLDALAGSNPQLVATPRLAGYGRLHPGRSSAAADAELTALVREASPGGYPGDPPATAVEQGPVKSAAEVAREQRIVLVVLGLLAIVLGLACANVSNLLLAGATTRDREIGVRLALGAGIGRIVRQMVVESLTLTTCATVAGAVVAAQSAPVMAVLAGMPDADVAIDRRVLFFLAATALLVGIGAALAPARHAMRGSVSDPLTAAGPAITTSRRTSRMRSVLVAFQAAASLVLLVLAALFARTLLHVTRLDPGFDVDRLVYVSARLTGPRPSAADEVRARDYWTAALERVRTLPGVERAALVMSPPFGGSRFIDPDKPDRLQFTATDDEFFATIGLRVLQGRTYSKVEFDAGAPIAVISQSAARRFGGTAAAIGMTLGATAPTSRLAGFRIIGVVSDTTLTELSDDPAPTVYVPALSYALTTLAVRSAAPRLVAGPLVAALQGLQPDVRVTTVQPADRIARERTGPRRLAVLSAGFGAFALILAASGLYAVTAFVVRLRRREMSIRLAIGASTRQVTRDILSESMRPVVAGLAVGLGAAWIGSRIVEGVLYGVGARDPAAYGVAALVLLSAGLIAVRLSARRVIHADPASALREGVRSWL